jgi:TolA-binding protein
MSASKLVLFLVFAVQLTGCAWLTQNQAASARYSQEVSVAQARTAEVEKELAEEKARIDALETSIRERGQSENDRLETLESVRGAVQQLRGDVEKLQFDVAELKKNNDAAAADADRRMLYSERRIGAIEQFLRIKPPPPPTDADVHTPAPVDGNPPDTKIVPDTNPPVDNPPAPQTVDEVLKAAEDHIQGGRAGVARALLQKAVDENPKSPKMAELLYRIAEADFAGELWGKAIKEYNVVVEGYPKSDWAAWSLLYQGDAFVKKGQPENARAFWEFATTTYPKSDAAKEAKKRLSGK